MFIHEHTHMHIYSSMNQLYSKLLLIYSPTILFQKHTLIIPKVFSTLGNAHSIERASKQISIQFSIPIDHLVFHLFNFFRFFALYEAGFLFCQLIFFLLLSVICTHDNLYHTLA